MKVTVMMMNVMTRIRAITAHDNSLRVIFWFYIACLAIFLALAGYQSSHTIAFILATAISATAIISAAILWFMALLLHWKVFWVFFVVHSLLVLFLTIFSYWFYAYRIGSSNSYLNPAFIQYLTYLRFTALCPAMSILRYLLTRKPDD